MLSKAVGRNAGCHCRDEIFERIGLRITGSMCRIHINFADKVPLLRFGCGTC